MQCVSKIAYWHILTREVQPWGRPASLCGLCVLLNACFIELVFVIAMKCEQVWKIKICNETDCVKQTTNCWSVFVP
jgi:hypothetical protein